MFFPIKTNLDTHTITETALFQLNLETVCIIILIPR